MTPTQLLAALPDGSELHEGAPVLDLDLTDVTHDSRQAGPGVLFACRPGAHADGHDYAPDAVAAGSPALLCERVLDLPVPQLVVGSVAGTLGPVAAAVHGHPSDALTLFGVTGTSGKTTTTYLLESVLRAAGHVTGLIGTVSGARTTPEATDLQRRLRAMVDAGTTGAAMEVSSHGLALRRVDGMRFTAAVFTNLGRDHLDFHRDFEDYYAAKARLFTGAFTPVGVVNVDDQWGRRLADSAPVRIVRVSPSSATADVQAGPDGSTFTAAWAGRTLRLHVRLPGLFNVANALCALAAAEAAGIDLDTAVEGIAELAGVPGRMEPVDAGQRFTVLVDYAHKPDALANVLASTRELAKRVIVVIGCGGDRDRGKRPLMGRIAAELADLAVLTSDNPRTEDPLAIIDAMVDGASGVTDARWTVEPDRRAAIALAFEAAAPGDVVVIAGKGHEPYQEIGDRVLPFDDRVVARELLS